MKPEQQSLLPKDTAGEGQSYLIPSLAVNLLCAPIRDPGAVHGDTPPTLWSLWKATPGTETQRTHLSPTSSLDSGSTLASSGEFF